VINVLKSQL